MRWVARVTALFAVLLLLTPAGIAALSDDSSHDADLERGIVTDPADDSTVVAIQGFHFEGKGSTKKPARLVSVGPRGNTDWVRNGTKAGAAWYYDVDPLDDGNLLVVSTRPDHTLVYELNPETKERVWTQKLDTHDTHDVDMLPNGDLVVADMRNYDEEAGRSNDRLFVYNRSRGEITWEWRFSRHYPDDTDEGIGSEDWTHVNDVDPIDEHRLLVSPRNFDQVIVLNRTTGEIEERLGADGNHEVLNEQHNPDYLESGNGTPTVLVADSENDRVVEYARDDDGWVRTWEVGGAGQLNWPRDADRLPNGNTLVTDSLNHRVIEVTPTGEIVWEYYATWGPYDAERTAHGDGSAGPTIRDQNASGTYELSGGSGKTPTAGRQDGFATSLRRTFAGTPLEEPANAFAGRWTHVTPWLRPVWMSGWDFLFATLAALVAGGWAVVELAVRRRRLTAVGRRFVRANR